MAALEVKDLAFSYGSHHVLRGVNFAAEPGDFIAVLGPNGVGKSTMFKCVLGFLSGYEGQVLVGGEDARRMKRKELARKVAYIPQSSEQVFDYTVLELVLMGSAARVSLFATPGVEEEQRALEVLAELGIEHLAYQGCGQISGGEYQLVLLARTLVQDAKVLVMDEPTANLDYGNQYRVMERIARLAKRDFVVMMAAHDPNQVLLHANRALVIDKGAVRADGAPADVMTDELLSSLYGIDVHRLSVEDADRRVNVCVPVGLGAGRGGSALAAGEGNVPAAVAEDLARDPVVPAAAASAAAFDESARVEKATL